MALAATVKPTMNPGGKYGTTYPCSIVSDWYAVVTNPETAETQALNGGSKAVKPGDVTSSNNRLYEVGANATHVLLALKYNQDATPSQDPIVKVFGKTPNGKWFALKDSAGNLAITLTTAVATDNEYDTTYFLTYPVQIDCKGAMYIMVCVETVFNVSAGTKTDSEILAKSLNSR